jgi:hypothetical protein
VVNVDSLTTIRMRMREWQVEIAAEAHKASSNVGRVESSVQKDETRRQRIEQRNTCPTIAELG